MHESVAGVAKGLGVILHVSGTRINKCVAVEEACLGYRCVFFNS